MILMRRFHKLVLINGKPKIGAGTRIGIFSEVYDKGGIVKIGAYCDIASFVAINCADSHRRTIGFSSADGYPDIRPITIGSHVFIGSHSFVGGDVSIGDNVVVAAGTILRRGEQVPSYSLVFGNPPTIKVGYYARKA